VEGIKNKIFRRIRRFRRVMKFKKIRIQPLCGIYSFWVLYLFFDEEDCGSFLCMILDWMWLKEFSWGKNVYVRLKINVKNMEISCTLIFIIESG